LPHPAVPQTSVGLPRGKPPPVISSNPWMPVAALGRVGLAAFFFLAVLVMGILWRFRADR
jgi:hypothetical protein